MKRLILLLLIIPVTLLTSLLSCQRNIDQSPREINFDRDICVLCLMGLADQKYSAQSINSMGEVLWYDDLGCLIFYMDSPDWEKYDHGNTVSYIADSQTGEWLRVEEAWYTYGDHTPMGYGYAAHKHKSDSAFDYATTRQRILDGITMREDFIKDKKMLHHD
ncbi:MAG: hypothetical protein WCR58_01180 [Bacteroidales bacterium]|nr:hypothetical protein [Bacteroidales bacterium]MDD3700461.1 hypothetical protein [Bacteroidales bacterium]MDY0368653.1 hypothetical protein [Bacteroidales bacterium]